MHGRGVASHRIRVQYISFNKKYFVGIVPQYTAKFFYEDSPNTLLNDAAMAGIQSVVLNFDCNVNNLIIS